MVWLISRARLGCGAELFRDERDEAEGKVLKTITTTLKNEDLTMINRPRNLRLILYQSNR